jgi:hypothetical protein
MKKKSPRGIPDFSSKGPKSGFLLNRKAEQQKAPKPASIAPKVKPQATSAKSGGRRGG